LNADILVGQKFFLGQI